MEPMVKSFPPISMLLVEDEKSTLNVLAITLSRKYPGVTLYAANNGSEALELFSSHIPDIVITDINMPQMGGVQMIVKIRAIKPNTKFIVLTGDTGKLSMEASVGDDFEVDHYIVKPISFNTLFTAIDQCLGVIAQQI